MIAPLITLSAHKISTPGPSFWGFALAMFCMSLCHTAGAQPSPQPKGQVAPYPAAKDPTKKAPGKVPPIPANKGSEEESAQEVPGKQAAPVQNTKKAGPSTTSGKLAFLLEIQDPTRLMQSAPHIEAKSAQGRSFKGVIQDDGKPPDQAPGDKTYTGPIHNVDGTNLTSILITSGDLKWLIEVELNEGAGADRIAIQLKEKGKASYNFKARGAASAGDVAPSNATPSEAPKPTPSKAVASKKKAKWPLIIAASTAGVLLCIVLILRCRNRSQMLELEGGVATGVFPPPAAGIRADREAPRWPAGRAPSGVGWGPESTSRRHHPLLEQIPSPQCAGTFHRAPRRDPGPAPGSVGHRPGPVGQGQRHGPSGYVGRGGGWSFPALGRGWIRGLGSPGGRSPVLLIQSRFYTYPFPARIFFSPVVVILSNSRPCLNRLMLVDP